MPAQLNCVESNVFMNNITDLTTTARLRSASMQAQGQAWPHILVAYCTFLLQTC